VMIEEPKGNADPHWTKKGRATLAGLLHFIVCKIENGNWTGIPPQWQGKEPSIPMLIDWMTEATLAAADELDKLKKTNPMAAMTADPVKNFLMTAVKEARDANEASGEMRYSQRAIGEMTQLANTPDKERGSIISSMDGGLIVFKNSAVIARTSKSDFAFRHFRGWNQTMEEAIQRGEVHGLHKYNKPENWKPLTLYLCVNVEDARALGMITGLLCESLSAWLIAHKPNSKIVKKDRDGQEYEVPVGPFPSLFVLDEFPQLPKLQALIDGPAVGRGQKVSYLMIGQDLGQITAKYGKDETETVISTTAAKVVLPLNNEQTAKRFSEMVGQKTLEMRSRSRTVGLSKDYNPFAFNLQRSFQGQPLIRPEDFMSIEKGKHFVLFQGYKNRPIKCDTPMYFQHKTLKHLVNPENGGKYPAAPFMPDFLKAARQQEWEKLQEEERLKAFELAERRRNQDEARTAAMLDMEQAQTGGPAPALEHRPAPRPSFSQEKTKARVPVE
jgi:type IV secretory pathway TraG/TraD family ATPase VirD4